MCDIELDGDENTLSDTADGAEIYAYSQKALPPALQNSGDNGDNGGNGCSVGNGVGIGVGIGVGSGGDGELQATEAVAMRHSQQVQGLQQLHERQLRDLQANHRVQLMRLEEQQQQELGHLHQRQLTEIHSQASQQPALPQQPFWGEVHPRAPPRQPQPPDPEADDISTRFSMPGSQKDHSLFFAPPPVLGDALASLRAKQSKAQEKLGGRLSQVGSLIRGAAKWPWSRDRGDAPPSPVGSRRKTPSSVPGDGMRAKHTVHSPPLLASFSRFMQSLAPTSPIAGEEDNIPHSYSPPELDLCGGSSGGSKHKGAGLPVGNKVVGLRPRPQRMEAGKGSQNGQAAADDEKNGWHADDGDKAEVMGGVRGAGEGDPLWGTLGKFFDNDVVQGAGSSLEATDVLDGGNDGCESLVRELMRREMEPVPVPDWALTQQMDFLCRVACHATYHEAHEINGGAVISASLLMMGCASAVPWFDSLCFLFLFFLQLSA